MAVPKHIFEGICILDFTQWLAGPQATRLLVDLGAEVIKVEPIGGKGGVGDATRYLTSSGSGFFAAFSRNKKSVTLDLDAVDGVTVARELIASADVFIENFRPGGLDSKGLGYAALAKDHPRLIYCSLKGFLTGPYEQRTALDEVVQMMTGLAYMTGPVGQPLRAGAPVNDMMGGMFGAIAVLAALRLRDQTGQGQHVQSGLFENAAWLVSTHMMQAAISGQVPPPMSAGKRAWGVYDTFETADGVKLFVGVVTERQWDIFTRALADPVLTDPGYATNNERSRRRDTLIPLVAGILKKHRIADLEAMCERAGLPFSRIQTPVDLFNDPHLNAGGMIALTLPSGQGTKIPALPIQFGEARLPLRYDLPKPGEHNDEVFATLRKRS